MEQLTAIWIKEEYKDVVLNEPGSMFLQDPLKVEEEPGFHVKQDVELKLDMDGSQQKGPVYPSSMNIKEEIEDGVKQEFIEDPLCIENPVLYIKQDPELQLDVDGCEHNVVASRSYASNNTRLLQTSGTCDIPFEENVRQGMGHIELEIGSEEPTHIATFREGVEEEKDEEESLSAPKLKCSLREKKCQIFTCSFCLQSFSSKYRLIIHVFVHIDGVQPPKFVCKSCGEVFPSYVSLKKHLKINDTGQDSSADKEERFDCSGEHGSTVLEDDHQDPGMDQTERHCSSNEPWKSITDKCNQHINTHNAEIRDRNVNHGTPGTTGKVDTHTVPHLAKTFHKCDVCGKRFTTLRQLKTHGLKHTGTTPRKCHICVKSFTRLCNLKRHLLIHTGLRSHKCDICGKSFIDLVRLKTHALIHTGQKPHKCDTCDKSFTRLDHLKTHTLIHTGLKPHKCNICDKSFGRLDYLNSHVLIHTATKAHKCDICGKCFTHSGELKRHSLTHTGTRPHKCGVCGKSFIQLGQLKSHALMHTGMLNHKCDICGKSFIQLPSLKNHLLMHTGTRPHKCDICGKSFSNSGNLKKHSLIHTGARPHKCDTCGKSFIQWDHLKSHSLIHTGMKTHKCDICGKSFTRLESLKRHELIHKETILHK